MAEKKFKVTDLLQFPRAGLTFGDKLPGLNQCLASSPFVHTV